ncbi:hypothetical protein [Nocardioides sp.]|uniref:O-antigen ligase family protein n=1 Tax=Nocardioides sp. TaxID=35761 RepID=UPI002B276D0E|nr:hypothetical protein [Nocardioides sp.]
MISGDIAISSLLLLVLGLLALGHVAVALLNRPQRGLLLLAALLPFDGLLLLLPVGELLGPWKEVLLVLTLGAAVIVPNSDRAARQATLPVWVPAAIAFVALGLLSAALTGGLIAFWGLKVSYFYAVVPAIMWLAPFTARDRDRLVSILMGTGIVTALFGLAQQVLGPDRLNAMGFEYNTAIRFSGSLLRSFSTFTQPFSFGLFMSLVLLVCLPVALSDWRRTRNRIFLASTPLLVVGMAASVVRGATLALIVGLVVLIIWRFHGLVYAFTIPAIGLLFVPASFLEAYFSSSSLGQRTSGWQTIFDSLLGAPLGNGIGTTGSAAEKSNELGVDASELVTDAGTLNDLYLPDNQYIKTVIELGPIGLWLLLLLGAAVIAAAVSAARRATGDDRALAMGIAASVWGAAAASLVGTYLEIFPLDFYFWLLVGVLLSLGTTKAVDDGEPTAARQQDEVEAAC